MTVFHGIEKWPCSIILRKIENWLSPNWEMTLFHHREKFRNDFVRPNWERLCFNKLRNDHVPPYWEKIEHWLSSTKLRNDHVPPTYKKWLHSTKLRNYHVSFQKITSVPPNWEIIVFNKIDDDHGPPYWEKLRIDCFPPTYEQWLCSIELRKCRNDCVPSNWKMTMFHQFLKKFRNDLFCQIEKWLPLIREFKMTWIVKWFCFKKYIKCFIRNIKMNVLYAQNL